jgi:hypothetical protein
VSIAAQDGGTTLLDQAEASLAVRRLGVVLDHFARAESAGADADRCAAGRWQVHMLAGEFERAWQESDAIRERGAPDPHRLWKGEELQGRRVMLRCLHGFGDAVQFLRYVSSLRKIASTLVIEVSPRFVPLAQYFDGVEEVITWGEQAPFSQPKWDVQIEVMELPYLFRTQMNELPLSTRYLRLPPCLTARFTLPQHHGLKVGVAWSAGGWNTSRAIPIETLQPVFETRGCAFWSLQESSDRSRSMGLPDNGRVYEDAHCGGTLEGLAATIAQLDLVITVDTLTAHLAGALGVPGWVLLQHAADWRWMHARDDSPWYPSLRLFRQPSPGDWEAVIAAVSRALGDWSLKVVRERRVA